MIPQELPVSFNAAGEAAVAAPPTKTQRLKAAIDRFVTPNVASTGTALSAAMAAVGVNFLTASRAGYDHANQFAPGVALTAIGDAGTFIFQALAPPGASDKVVALLGNLCMQSGVILNQVGDSLYDSATHEVDRSHGKFIAGAAIATWGAMILGQSLVLQASGAQSSRGALISSTLGFIGAVGAGAVTGFSASSAADTQAGRIVGLTVIVAGVGVGLRGLVTLAKRAQLT